MNKFIIKFRHIFYHRGDVISGVLVVIILCVSVSSLMQKEYMECLNQGLSTDNCVYFSANVSEDINFWDVVDNKKITSLSYIPSNIEDALPEYFKYISFGESIRLPVQSKMFQKFSVKEWNGSKGIAFVGRELRTEEDGGQRIYCSYETYQSFCVVGEIGINKTTLIDLFLYLPYDGIIKSRQTKTTFIAEGYELSEVLDGLADASDYLAANNLGSIEIIRRGLADETSVPSLFIVATIFSVAVAVYLYVVYFWLLSSRKQTYVLLLFGIPKFKIWLNRWVPALICSFVCFFIWSVLFQLLSGLIGEFIKYWNMGLLMLIGVNLLYGIMIFISIFKIKDLAQHLKN